ncbi:MAG TPA: chitobiase/beta-hexosaminidase C-terminal domain-containing protein, partial [Nevskiaceae bacterium]|nr:chitobiase/beta-hexosaminidase C-terminal domain-containing protein [Nevskiaceae bacterium]
MNLARRGAAVMLVVLALAACAPRAILLPGFPPLRDFPADFVPPVSEETGLPMGGFGGTGGGVHHTPILFVHGNTESAGYWLAVREAFRDAGWHDDELWAFSYGWNNPRWFDSNDASVPSVGRMVDAMTQYLSKKTGREVRQVHIVAHSLGVTAVRQWMLQENAWHRVRAFVAVAGANHGTWTARADARGQNRTSSFELAPGSGWLAQLNRVGETPGPTRVLALYDGTGRYDAFYPPPFEDSSRLEGAANVALNRERGLHLDHMALARAPAAVETIIGFLRDAGEALPQAAAPILVQEGDRVRGNVADDRVHCTTGAVLPSRATPGVVEVQVSGGGPTTCFATNARTGLASPMQRFHAPAAAVALGGASLTLSADPPAGAFEDRLRVRLAASDPAATIVYTTSGGAPTSGSPRYLEPIVVDGPLTLRAVAIAADGRRSEELRLRYDVSLRLVE